MALEGTTPVSPGRWPAGLIVLASIGALGFAFIAQYGFDLQPCVLCLYQRWPFAIAIALGLFALAAQRPAPRLARAVLALTALAFIVNAGIAGYHVGVEQHWWQGTAACTGGDFSAVTVDQLRAQIMAAPVVRCDQVAWSLFGISMAGYNVVLSAGLALFAGLFAWRARAA